MALNIVSLPYEYYPDPTVGRPVYNGSIYVGIVDADPTIPSNQKQITLRQEDGTEVEVPQPVTTGAGGVVLYNGSPAQVLVDGEYSISVLNKTGIQVYYSANVNNGAPLSPDTVGGVTNYESDSTGNMVAGITIDGTVITQVVGQVWRVGRYSYRLDTAPAATLSDFTTLDLSFNFLSVDEAKAALPIPESSVAATDFVIETSGYYGTYVAVELPQGGGTYTATTLERARTVKGDVAWVPDGFVDHYLFGGTDYVMTLDTDGIIYSKQAGARGDGATDDSPALQAAINHAQAITTSRFTDGATVRVTKGDYLIGTRLLVDQSQIGIIGDGIGATVFTAGTQNLTTLFVDGDALSVYGFTLRGVKFKVPNGGLSGACLSMRRVVNSIVDDVIFDGYYDAIILNGCAKVFLSKLLGIQTSRLDGTNPNYAMDFRSTSFNNSDIHVSTYNFALTDTKKSDYAMRIQGADGIYFINGHHQGGVLIEPAGIGLTTTASVFWTQVYFDTTDDMNVKFAGGATNYRNFGFEQCYFRTGVSGFSTTAITSSLSNLTIANGTISSHERDGIVFGTNVIRAKIIGNTFKDNASNTTTLGDSDIRTNASSLIINANSFEGGR